jgi:hypothetical protein
VRGGAFVVYVVLLVLLAGCGLFMPPVDESLLYEETFSDPSTTAWPQFDRSDLQCWVADGRYNMLVKVSGYPNTWESPDLGQAFDNFRLDVDVIAVSGTDDHGQGVIFRRTYGIDFYTFEIRPLGAFALWKDVGDMHTVIQDWTTSSAIHTGKATNHLAVVADGTHLTFYVNETKVLEETDTSISAGAIGFIVSTYGEGNVHVGFDNVTVHSVE